MPDADVFERGLVARVHEPDLPVAFHTLEVHQVVIDVKFHHVRLDDQSKLKGGTEVQVAPGSLKDFQLSSISLDFAEMDGIPRQKQALPLRVTLVEENAVLSAVHQRRIHPLQRAFDHVRAAQVQFLVQHPKRRGVIRPGRD